MTLPSTNSPPGPAWIVVNADDFGLSNEVNQAIIESFEAGAISSSTIMANMPAFESACRWAVCTGRTDRIGVHLNFSDGVPLTDAIRRSRVFCDDGGNFLRRMHYRLNIGESRLLEGELDAQIRRCRDAGLPLTYADSHRHAHGTPAVFLVVRRVLRRHGVPSIRILCNMDRSLLNIPRQMVKSCLNAWIARAGLRATEFCGTAGDFERHSRTRLLTRQSVEVITHPRFHDDHGGLVDLFDDRPFVDHLCGLTEGFNVRPFGSGDSVARAA